MTPRWEPSDRRRGRIRLLLASLVGLSASACSGPAGEEHAAPISALRLELQDSGTDVLLQAVSAVSDSVVWVSGHGGTWARSVNGGRTWETHVMPDADSLEFRDVHALDAERAWLLSSGPGDRSRVYRTRDGGVTWELQFLNPEPSGFYDCLQFRDERFGVLYGDAVDGELRILLTRNGGRRWEFVRGANVPDALAGEGGFAASGTCVALGPDGRAWIGTGAGAVPRVLATRDEGRTWFAVRAPIAGGEAAGIFTIAFRDTLHGALLGGDLAQPEGRTDNVAVTADGGMTWTLAGRPVMAGAVYGAAYVPGAPTPTLVAVGPEGLDWSVDEGHAWLSADTAAWWGIGIASPRAGWAVGPRGSIARLRFE